MAASFRITLWRNGKKPARLAKAVDCDDRDDAVYVAMQWILWSHGQGRPRKLPRYAYWRVEERADSAWAQVREGTITDATVEFSQKDSGVREIGAMEFIPFTRSQARQAVGEDGRGRRPRGGSRLAQFVTQKLKDL